MLEEFASVLSQLGVEIETIGSKMQELLKDEKIELIPVQKINFIDAINLIASEKSSFKKTNDKIILSIAIRRKIPIFSFDKELKKEGRKNKVELI